MKKSLLLVAAAFFATSVFAEPILLVSLGTRETGSTAPIGEPGGTGGSIEWVNLDGQTLVLDGTWQQFTFDMDMDPLTPFTGDGILDGLAGTIEHIRLRSAGFYGPFTLWIDDVADTIDPAGPPPPTTVTFGTFEGYLDGDEVMFQEPTFSGSTNAFIDPEGPDYSGVDNTVAYSGEGSVRVEWQFVEDEAAWLRLTTYTATLIPQGDPTIAYDQDSVVSFWIRGIPEPTSLLLLGVPALALLRRRR